jgi:hypothetical protein
MKPRNRVQPDRTETVKITESNSSITQSSVSQTGFSEGVSEVPRHENA